MNKKSLTLLVIAGLALVQAQQASAYSGPVNLGNFRATGNRGILIIQESERKVKHSNTLTLDCNQQFPADFVQLSAWEYRLNGASYEDYLSDFQWALAEFDICPGTLTPDSEPEIPLDYDP